MFCPIKLIICVLDDISEFLSEDYLGTIDLDTDGLFCDPWLNLEDELNGKDFILFSCCHRSRITGSEGEKEKD